MLRLSWVLRIHPAGSERGAEDRKGKELGKNAFPLFKKSGLNFIGNVEGYDIPAGKANVVVCDGFVGNVLIKFLEALGHIETRWLEKKLKGKLPDDDIREICDSLRKMTNAADTTGGGPIWAVNGLAVKAHGRSEYDGIFSALLATKDLVEKDIVNVLKKELAEIRSRLNVPGV